MSTVPGLDLDRFREFFERARPGAVAGPLRASIIAGGKSNLTYEITDGEHSWIVRRPPLGHILATAHDVSREYVMMTALAPTPVPVPVPIALCDDASVMGSPFYVMQKVTGTPYRVRSQLERLGVDRTRAIADAMVDSLLVLHSVDPFAVGLGGFGRPDGFLSRQLRRWQNQLEGSRTRDLAGAAELCALLQARVPTASTPGIVHGDFRLDNLLVDAEDRVAAIIDWEMATVGDPLTDVGLLLVYRHLADLEAGHVIANAAAAKGFASGEEMLARYSLGSPRNLAEIGFYVGLAYFKLAVILEGIHYRYTHGQTVGEGFAAVGAAVQPLIGAGLESMKECTI